jgi:hypothetical protein
VQQHLRHLRHLHHLLRQWHIFKGRRQGLGGSN